MRHQETKMTLTPDGAKQLLEDDLFEGQRQVNRHHVQFLADAFRAGTFDTGAPLRIARVGKRDYLVDGQHRVRMVASIGKAVEFSVVISHCRDVAEVGALYARIDRGRPRSIGDALNGLGVADTTGLSSWAISKFMATAPFFATGFAVPAVRGTSYVSKSAEARVDAAAPYLPAAKQWFSAIAGAHGDLGRLLMRREVVAIGVATFVDSPARDRAENFWIQVARDSGLQYHDPRKQCIEIMRKTAPSPQGYGALAHGVVFCWNAYFRKYGQVKRVVITDPKARLSILGTRWAEAEEPSKISAPVLASAPAPRRHRPVKSGSRATAHAEARV